MTAASSATYGTALSSNDSLGFDTASFNRSLCSTGESGGRFGGAQGWQGGDIDSGEIPAWTESSAGPEDDADNDFDFAYRRR